MLKKAKNSNTEIEKTLRAVNEDLLELTDLSDWVLTNIARGVYIKSIDTSDSAEDRPSGGHPPGGFINNHNETMVNSVS
ncbi:MAG: hypothetical protein AAFW75_13305 [Cyanobacteria bacterium J06636_16]